jgi:4-amino-4-deoxy-L-arabinose transferase-like glycosyltransferase
MVESGDWLTPTYNYEPRFQKPILYYWLAAAAFEVAGVSEAAARFPSALAGLGLTLLTYFCGRRWFGPDVGLVGGLIVATNFGYYSIARLALPDLPLAFFITLSAWAAFESLRSPAPGQGSARPARGWLLVSAAAAGLAFLTKGPVGVALPALVVGASLVVGRDWRGDVAGPEGARAGARFPWRGTDLALAAAVFVIVAAPWYAAMADRHGVGYLHRFFVGENLERFATDRYNDPRPLGFYLPVVFGGLLPWSPVMLLWVPAVVAWLGNRRRLAPAHWRLVLWAGLPLLFYSLSIGQQPRYVLPILPPLAVLVARTIRARVDAAATTRRGVDPALAWCATTSALVLAALGILLWRGTPLLFALEPRASVVATAVIVTAAAAIAVVAWLGRPAHLVGTLAAASALTLLTLHFTVYSGAGLEPVQRMATEFSRHHAAGTPTGTYRVFVRNLVFYTGVKQLDLRGEDQLQAFLRSSDRVLCVLRATDLARIEPTLRPVRLSRVTYFNPAALRLRTLVHPDPAHDLDQVWLVANR